MSGQVNPHRGASSLFRVDPHLAAGLAGKPGDHGKAQPGAFTLGLVVKNGSNARAITAGGMPVPVSVTETATYWPDGMSRSRAIRSSSQVLAVSMVSLPPFGIACRALMHRLRIALSSWFGSQRV